MEIQLTWHQATEGNSSLTNKVPSNWVVIPDKEPHQNHLSHVKGKGQRLLPNGIKAWRKKMCAYENHYSNTLTKAKTINVAQFIEYIYMGSDVLN